MGKPRPKPGSAQTDRDSEHSASGSQETPVGTGEGLQQQQMHQILQAIADSKTALQSDIAQVSLNLGLLRADHGKLSDRVKQLESTIEEHEPTWKQTEVRMDDINNRLQTLERRAEDAEGRNRRNNIRVVGLPEGIEGTDMVAYLETWLRTEVAPQGLTQFYTLERAHRVPARSLSAGLPPRPVIARLLHFKDRDVILQQARTLGPFQVENLKVSIYPDYTLEVQRHRSSFLEVKKALRKEGIQYSLLFPARLKLILDGTTLFFETPNEAWDWLDTYRGSRDRGGEATDSARGCLSRQRPRRTPRRRPRGPTPPQSQTERERLAVLKAVSEISKVVQAAPVPDTDSEKGSEDRGSEATDTGSVTLPHVTPGTAERTV